MADHAAAATPTPASQSPYREIELRAVGRVTGRIEIAEDVGPDSIERPTIDADVCGPPRRAAQTRAGQRGGVVVWIDGLRSGKRLPLERRFTITQERCQFMPRVQAAIVGGTLNVLSVDPIPHNTRIVAMADDRSLALVRQTGDGQVVPVDSVLRQPGRLELRCDFHPWTRAWIQVFDQPYFTTTTSGGSFALDSVPPGRYRIVAWHERAGEMSDSLTVSEGGVADIVLRGRARP
jgi:hypothetical protein